MATLQSTTVAGSMSSGGNTVWHANNDGAGTSLNVQFIGGWDITHLDVKARTTALDLSSGAADTFWPMLFNNAGWGNGVASFSIRKSDVHQGGGGAGTLYGRFRYRTQQWGHHGLFWEMEDNWGGGFNYPYISAFDGVSTDQRGCIWLRGATTYYYQFDNPNDGFTDTTPTTGKTQFELNGSPITRNSRTDVIMPGNSRYVQHAVAGKRGFSLGTSVYRWGTVFATAQNASSDIRLKENIGVCLGAEFLRKLKPRTYIRKAPYELPEDLENSPLKKYPDGDRRNVGFIAQEVRDLLIEMNIPIEDFAGFDGSDPTHLSLIYAEFVPVIVKSLQEKRALIKRLRQRIESLEERT